MTLVLPLVATPAQTFQVVLDGVRCTVRVYEKKGYPTSGVVVPALYLDLDVQEGLVLGGVLCLHGVGLVRNRYLRFPGELVFYDTVATADPLSAGLGTRWQLIYTGAR